MLSPFGPVIPGYFLLKKCKYTELAPFYDLDCMIVYPNIGSGLPMTSVKPKPITKQLCEMMQKIESV